MLAVPIYRECKKIRLTGNFNVDQNTMYKLVQNAAGVLRPLYMAMLLVVLKDKFKNVDESYIQMFKEIANSSGEFVRKAYIWFFVGMECRFRVFYFKDGSRKAEVFENLVQKYVVDGIIQTDSYVVYRYAEGVFRIACLLHLRRGLLELAGLPDADRILGHLNKLFRLDAVHKVGEKEPDGHIWTEEEHKAYRATFAPQIIDEMMADCRAILASGKYLEHSPLYKAISLIISEEAAIRGIFTEAFTSLTNNTAYHNFSIITNFNPEKALHSCLTGDTMCA